MKSKEEIKIMKPGPEMDDLVRSTTGFPKSIAVSTNDKAAIRLMEWLIAEEPDPYEPEVFETAGPFPDGMWQARIMWHHHDGEISMTEWVEGETLAAAVCRALLIRKLVERRWTEVEVLVVWAWGSWDCFWITAVPDLYDTPQQVLDDWIEQSNQRDDVVFSTVMRVGEGEGEDERR